MITLRRNTERHHARRGKHDTWFTFHRQDRQLQPRDDFEVLAAFDEIRLPPGGNAAPLSVGEAELVTYVYRGTLAQEDSNGSSGVVHSGEFQRITLGPGIRPKERSASRSDWVHLFRISLKPSVVGMECAKEQKHFVAAQRHNELCVIASPDGRKASLRVHQDVLIHSSVLDPGHHIIHELLPGRSVWLHIIYGEATLQDITLTQGDGAGVTSEPSVSFTAQEDCEVLLVDLGPMPRSFASDVRLSPLQAIRNHP